MQKDLQEIEAKVHTTRSKLQLAQMCHRRFQCKVHALKARSQSATETLAAEVVATAAARAPPTAQQATSPPEPACMQLEPLHTHSRKYNPQHSSVPEPIGSYKRCESVACAEIAPCMQPSQDCTGSGFNLIQKALEEYQQTVSSHASLKPQDICWFIQFPYAIVPDLYLSYSAGLNSPECALSISLCYSMASAECMFLTLELEALEASGNPNVTPPAHAFVKQCEGLLASGRKGFRQKDLLSGGTESSSVSPAVLELVQNPPDPDPEITSQVRLL